MTQRSLLRYTKSVNKLCMEHGKESDDSGDEGSQGVKIYSGPQGAVPTKTSSGRIGIESLFGTSHSNSNSRAPITASVSAFPLSVSNSKSPPTSPTGAQAPAHSDANGKKHLDKSDKSGSRRPLTRESASFNLSVRQIVQEGAPKEAAHRPTMNRKDTITVYDWFRAMDEEAEKEKAMRGTLRAQGITRSNTLRPQPTKTNTRVNSNFEFFKQQAEATAPPQAAQPPTQELPKSKSLPRVESRWGIFESNNASKAPMGSVRLFDTTRKKYGKGFDNNAQMGKQIAEDDESLKVFMQAWNMLDTFEEHLAVHIELDKAEEERQQMAKEQPPVVETAQPAFDPSTQLIDVSFTTTTTTTTPSSSTFPLDSPAIKANDLLPPDLVLLLTSDVALPPESPLLSPSSPDFKGPKPDERIKLEEQLAGVTLTPTLTSIPTPTTTTATTTTTTPATTPTTTTPATPSTDPPATTPPSTTPVPEPTKESPRTTEPTPTTSPTSTTTAESPRTAEPAVPVPTEPAVVSPRTTEPAVVSPRTTEPEIVSPRTTETEIVSPRTAEPTTPTPSTPPPVSTEASALKQELLAALTTTTAPTSDVEPVKPEPVPVVDIPEDYTGPHYSKPITEDFMENLFQYCATEGSSSLVPRGYVEQILRDAMELFKSEPTIIDIPLLEKDHKVVVVGDIHGQFPDLITILRDTGLPGPKQTIVFNGDFVDRGPAGVEVLLCLYCMKLYFPKNVYIHRGNHELESINRKYNFADQVITKYDDKLFLLIQDSFAQLPLGCVIAKKVLVIHGGLPEDPVSLNQIRQLPKLREDPTKATGGPEKLVQGILWSDPRDRRGAKPSKRGAGVEFGPDITAAFLARSDLDLLVRSHEMVEEGFALAHGGNVMTIFSASYYCGVSTNKGAFAVFTSGGDMKKPTIVQYYAQAYAARDNVLKSCVKETLEKLREMIFVNRHRLCLDFCMRDTKNSGKITKHDWCESMSSVMGLHIGWQGMLPYLAKVESDKINYSKFLDRYKITKEDDDDLDDDEDEENEEKKAREKAEALLKSWQKETMGYMCANMHSMIATSLSDAFKKFDKNGDGKIDYKEFMEMLTTLQLELTPHDDNQYYDLMRRLDVDEDGMISLKDWEERMGNHFERVKTLHKEEWIPSALIIMRAAIDKNFDFIANQKSRLKSAFRKCRAEGGKVQRRGFTDWIERALEIESFTSVQKLRLAMYVDFNGNGKISWKEFKKVFKTPEYYDTIQSNLFKPPAK